MDIQFYTMDNTDGYTQEQLDAWNAELAEAIALAGLEPCTDAWYDCIKRHNETIAWP